MKPDWDELGEKYESSKKVLIGDVDCTADQNKKLCEDHGVTGYPTLKYYVPGGDRTGEKYEGDRDLDSLKKFIKTLGPPCGPLHLGKCTAEQKAQLEAYMAMPAHGLGQQLRAEQNALSEAEAAHAALLKALQQQYEESDTKIKALKEDKGPAIKLMKAALANLTAAPPADAPSTKNEL